MKLFDFLFGKIKKTNIENTKQNTISCEKPLSNSNKEKSIPVKRITVRNLPHFCHLEVPKGITKSKIEKYDINDGEEIVAIYDPEKSETIEFVIRKSCYGDYGPKLGTLSEEASKRLFELFSYKSYNSPYFTIEIDGVLQIDSLDASKPKVIVKLFLPYDTNIQGLPIFTKVVGVSYDNRQEFLKQCFVNDGLLIKHKPIENHPEALEVIHLSTGNKIGYIKSQLATDLIIRFGEGVSFNGCVTRRNLSEDGICGCNIQIMSVNNIH